MSILSGGIVRNAPPKDGVWSGGAWQGLSYQSWGWLEGAMPLATLPYFDIVNNYGCTKAQILSGLMIESSGFLSYNGGVARVNGADSNHGFRLIGPTFEKPGFEFSSRHYLGDSSLLKDNRVVTGVETIDEHGDPFLMQGALTNEAHFGYLTKTNTSTNTTLATFDTGSTAGNSSGNSYRFFSHQLMPNMIRLLGMRQVIAKWRITNGASEYTVDDPRPTGVDLDEYYFRPFIEIDVRLLSGTSKFEHLFHDFLVSGTPKTT